MSHTLILEREFQASKELVFRAWTEKDLMFKWMCPTDFRVTFVEVDFCLGGKWRSGMLSPDGEEYIMLGEYRKIEPYSCLEFTHSWQETSRHSEHVPGLITVVTVELTDCSVGTKMTFTQAGLRDEDSREGHGHGWSGAFGHLADLVASLKTDS